MIRALRLILIIAIVSAGCTRSSGKPDESLGRVKQAGVLKVAIDPSYPPFSFLSGNGEVVGYDVDLSRALADRLGVKVTYVAMDVTSIFDGLIAKKADVAVSAVSPAWEYAEEIGFSRSYFNAGQVLVQRKDARSIAKPEELVTATIGVEIGSAGEVEGRNLARTKPGISLRTFDSPESALDALSAGWLDGVIADRVTTAMLLQERNGFRLAGEPITIEPYVVAVRGSDRTLLNQIDLILENMGTDGFLKSLDKRWIESENNAAP